MSAWRIYILHFTGCTNPWKSKTIIFVKNLSDRFNNLNGVSHRNSDEQPLSLWARGYKHNVPWIAHVFDMSRNAGKG